MLPVEVGFAALFGLVFGSFLNVCILRLPRSESILHPGSHCRSCGKALRPRDNVPLASWLWLRGRSRCCRQPVSPLYPIVEAGTAALFVATLLIFGLTLQSLGMTVFCWLLFGLLWMDAREYLLPDAFTLPGIVLGVLFHAASASSSGAARMHAALASLGSACAIGGFLLLASLLYKLVRRRDGMGFGDVKLGAMLGAWLDWRLGALALFIAIIAGAIVGVALLLSQRSGTRDDEPYRLPFGTFLAGAGVLVVFAGKPMLAWYTGFF